MVALNVNGTNVWTITRIGLNFATHKFSVEYSHVSATNWLDVAMRFYRDEWTREVPHAFSVVGLILKKGPGDFIDPDDFKGVGSEGSMGWVVSAEAADGFDVAEIREHVNWAEALLRLLRMGKSLENGAGAGITSLALASKWVFNHDDIDLITIDPRLGGTSQDGPGHSVG